MRIFISSPGDVAHERLKAREILDRLRSEYSQRVVLEPYYWEYEPFDFSKSFGAQIPNTTDFDVVLCFLWTRLGTPLHHSLKLPDGSPARSGTEFEISWALDSQKKRCGLPELHVWVNRTVPLFKPDPELHERISQWNALKQFLEIHTRDSESGASVAAYTDYRTLDEFEELLETKLRKIVDRHISTNAPATKLPPQTKPTWDDSPFRGLEPFDIIHAPVFFGRTRAIGKCIEAVRKNLIDPNDPRGFLLVLGSSGSGKSSLVRAGILPTLLEPGVIEGVGLWRYGILKPSDAHGSPATALAAALLADKALPELREDGIAPERFAARFEEKPEALVETIIGALRQITAIEKLRQKTALEQAIGRFESEQRTEDVAATRARLANLQSPQSRFVLLIDQFEELFAGNVTLERRRAFVASLAMFARSGRIIALATLRSDFYARCAEEPELVRLMAGTGIYHLLAPTPVEIGQLIRQPAAAAGLQFEGDPGTQEYLDDLLRDEAVKHPETLPLLEFSLQALYEQRSSTGLLTLEAYRHIGGVEGALATRAEAIFAILSPAAQAAFPLAARFLVRINQNGQGLRRPASAEALASDPAIQEFVNAFVAARLFVTDKSDAGLPTVAVAHEALFRAWKRMADWLRDNREFLFARARIEQNASTWEEKLRDAAYLLPAGKPLEEAEDIMRQQRSAFSDSGRAYIEASMLAVQEAAVEKVRERQRAALRQMKGAEELWEKFQTTGQQATDEWRFTRLAEIETLLVDSLALDHELTTASSLLAGIRRLLVETGIKTRDLNLASIYLQKLKTMSGAESGAPPELGATLETAWAEVDPARNKYVLRMRKIALIACWLPFVWQAMLLFFAAYKFEGMVTYILVSNAVATNLQLFTGIFAIMMARGAETVFKINATIVCSLIASVVALNLLSFSLNIMLLNNLVKVKMQKLFWSEGFPS